MTMPPFLTLALTLTTASPMRRVGGRSRLTASLLRSAPPQHARRLMAALALGGLLCALADPVLADPVLADPTITGPQHAAAALAAPDCPTALAAPTAEQLQSGLRNARDRGLLWRLQKDGQEGWLYGTLHVGRLAWAFPGPRITQALLKADTVALEIDPTDPALAPTVARAMAALQAQLSDPVRTAALGQRLGALAERECLAPGLANQPLLLQALALTVLSGRRDGLDPALGQEQVLSGFARASRKSLVSLETIDIQLAALLPQDPAELLPSLQRAVERLESGRARREVARLAAAWADGDLAGIADYAAWCDCLDSEADRAYMKRINDQRNPALADAIAARLGAGQRVFAAVGALHMTGPASLPLLMAQRSYSVQRVD